MPSWVDDGSRFALGPGEHRFRLAWAGPKQTDRAETWFSASVQSALERWEQELGSAHGQLLDCFCLPEAWIERPLGAVVSDMDSTIIEGESLDDLAAELGVGEAVANITARAMRGELDFGEALAQRFALLGPVSRAQFELVGVKTQMNKGIEHFMDLAKGEGAQCVLATGGFDMIAQVVANRLGIEQVVANRVAFDNAGRFLGRLDGELVDASTKKALVEEQQARAQQSLVVAMGDGANDIPMIQQADVGIAYRAKPAVRQKTQLQLNFADFSDLGWLLGRAG